MKPKKRLPKFKSEAEERRFWATHDSTEYLDWSKAERVVFPNLKSSVKTISIRLPESLLNLLKMLANEHDVPYELQLLDGQQISGIQAPLLEQIHFKSAEREMILAIHIPDQMS